MALDGVSAAVQLRARIIADKAMESEPSRKVQPAA